MDSATRLNFDGLALLQEQNDMLAQAPPADINYLHYLKLKLSAQQKATAQRNQQQRNGGAGVSTLGSPQGRLGTDNSSEEPSFARNSASGLPNMYDTASPLQSRNINNRDASVDGNVGMYPVESPNGSRRPWESPPQPTTSTRPAARDSVVNGSRSAPPVSASTSGGYIPLDEMPASVAKRRSMGEPASSLAGTNPTVSFDDMPAVARSRNGGLDGVPEQPTESVKLEECPYCGRTFAEGRLERHVDTCRRQQERDADLQRRRPSNRTATQRASITDGVTGVPPSVGSSGSTDSRKDSLPSQSTGVTVQPKRQVLTTVKVPPANLLTRTDDEYDEY